MNYFLTINKIILFFALFFLSTRIAFADVKLLKKGAIEAYCLNNNLTFNVVRDDSKEVIGPERMDIYFSGDKCSSVVVYYPANKNSFRKIANALEKIYGPKQSMAKNFNYWRVVEHKYAVSLTEYKLYNEKPSGKYILVTYRSWSTR